MKRDIPFWIDDKHWMCPRHTGMKFPSILQFCPFMDCLSKCTGRPDHDIRVPERSCPPRPSPVKTYLKIKEKPKVYPKKCAWHKCLNQAQPKRKYCSKACSNKSARKAYRERKKQERKDCNDQGRIP